MIFYIRHKFKSMPLLYDGNVTIEIRAFNEEKSVIMLK